MNVLEKIKRSWWVILSFIIFLNGFGFIYIAVRENNRNWLIEGIIYELPWFIFLIFGGIYGIPLFGLTPAHLIFLLALLLLFVSIIRSIWVAVKLGDVYDNEEKYTIKATELKRPADPDSDNPMAQMGCCVCIIAIFIMFMIAVL